MVAPPMALQTSLIRTSPAQSSPLSSSPLQNSHILNTPVNTPVQANTIQHKEQQDEDMMAAAIQLNSIMQKQQEGEEGGLRADLIQALSAFVPSVVPPHMVSTPNNTCVSLDFETISENDAVSLAELPDAGGEDGEEDAAV